MNEKEYLTSRPLSDSPSDKRWRNESYMGLYIEMCESIGAENCQFMTASCQYSGWTQVVPDFGVPTSGPAFSPGHAVEEHPVST